VAPATATSAQEVSPEEDAEESAGETDKASTADAET
jgi:hypothetical protein